MADWYVDAVSGNDTTGDGLSWGTAWASLVKAFAAIPTPSPSANQDIHVKGTHTIPSGGWVVAAANTPYSWVFNLRGYEGATILSSGPAWFSGTREYVGYFDFAIDRQLSSSVYGPPSQRFPSYTRCTFSIAGPYFSYDGGFNARFVACTFNSNVAIYANASSKMTVIDSHFNGGQVNLYDTTLTAVRCYGTYRTNYAGNRNNAMFQQCSFDLYSNYLNNDLRRLIIDRCVIGSGILGAVTEITDSAIGTAVAYSGGYINGVTVTDDLFGTGFEPSDTVAGLAISNPLTIGAIQATPTATVLHPLYATGRR